MQGRVFITGDKHRTFVPLFWLAERMELYTTDVLLIAGDAGYVWNKEYLYDIESLQQIFPGSIAFVDGNHENHDLLNGMEVIQWNGGKVHRVGERVYHLMRGEIYSIYEHTYFVFGGARSVDKDRRIEGESWWRAEEPTLEEVFYGKEQLFRNIDNIEYVITHEPPLFARKSIARSKQMDPDYMFPRVLEEWYQRIEQGSSFRKWYFGHMHVDQEITPKLQGVHHKILLIEDEKTV